MLARTPTDIGLLLREQRRRLGLGQDELAKRVGVSRQWIVDVEKGKPRAEVGLVLRTLEALGLTLDISVDAALIKDGDQISTIDIDDVLAALGSDHR